MSLQFAAPWATSRLVVAPAGADDEAALGALLTLPTVRDMLRPVEATLRRVTRPQRFVARLAGEGTLAGMLALEDGWLWYAVDPLHWGHGFGREIVHAALTKVAPALGLHGVQASVLRDNVRSRRLLESAGFRFLGPAWTDAPSPAKARAVLRYGASVATAQGFERSAIPREPAHATLD